MPTFTDYERTVAYKLEFWNRKYEELGKCLHCDTKFNAYPFRQEVNHDYASKIGTFIALCDPCFGELFVRITNKVNELSKPYGLYPNDYNGLKSSYCYGRTIYCLEDIKKAAMSKHKVDSIEKVFEIIKKRKAAKLAPRQDEVDEWFGENLEKAKEYSSIKLQIEQFLDKRKGSAREIFEQWEGLVFLDEKTGYQRLVNFTNKYLNHINAKAKILVDHNYLIEQALDDYVEDNGDHSLSLLPPYCQRLYKKRHPQVVFQNNVDEPEIAAVGC